ncbi:MAG: YceI family protein [bacterium]|nr:YceI family protein [bacterium]
MKKFALILSLTTMMYGVAIAGTGFSGVTSGQRTFKLSNTVGANSIVFNSDAPLEKIKGSADKVSGQFKLDPSNLEATSGSLEVSVASMSTAISKRDEHMRSSTWLDEEKYPTIVFEVQNLSDIRVENRNGRLTAVAKAAGKFTLHGVTKALVADITITYLPESADTKKRASGDLVSIKANFDVALKDFQIAGKSGLVGSKVGEVIQVETTLFANS